MQVIADCFIRVHPILPRHLRSILIFKQLSGFLDLYP